LDTVDCHRSPSVLLTPATTQNKFKSSSTMSTPATSHSGEHTTRPTLNLTRRSGENVVITSQKEPRVSSLFIPHSSKRVSFAKDILSDVPNSGSNYLDDPDSDNNPYSYSDYEKSNLLSQSNLSQYNLSQYNLSLSES